jgi:hypothetical protein
MKKILRVMLSGKHVMKYLLGALIGLVTLDGVLTELLVNKGTAWEANPLLQPLVGDVGFMVLKVVGALLCAFILWDVHRRFPRVGLIATSIAVTGYAVIVVWNTSLFLLA